MAERDDEDLSRLNSRVDGVQTIINGLLEELKSARKINSSRGQQTEVYHKVAGSAYKIPGLKLSSLPKPDEFLLNPLGHIDRIFELLASVSARGATLRTDCARRPERAEKLEIELDSNCSVQNSGKGYQQPYHQHVLSTSTFGPPRQIRVSNTSVSSNSSQIHLANLVSYSPTNQSALSQQHRQIEVSANSRAGHGNTSAECPPSFQQSSSTTDSTTRGQKISNIDHMVETSADFHQRRQTKPPVLAVCDQRAVGQFGQLEPPTCPLKSSSSLSSFQKLESKVISSLQQPHTKQLPVPQIKTKSLDEYTRNAIQSSDDYEFRFSNDLPTTHPLRVPNPAANKGVCMVLRESSSNSSAPVASKENMLSGYQSSEELSDSAEEAETHSKCTEDLLRSYHSVYSESDKPEVIAATDNSHKTEAFSEQIHPELDFTGLKVDLPTTDIPQNHKIRLSDVSLRILEEVDSRISAEMRLSSVKKDVAKTQSPFSCSKYFKVKKNETQVIQEESKENIPLGNSQSLQNKVVYGQFIEKKQEAQSRKQPVVLDNIYGEDSIPEEDSEIMVDENGDLYGITCRSSRINHAGNLQSNSRMQQSDISNVGKSNILREIKATSNLRDQLDQQSPPGRIVFEEPGCSLKSSIMSSQYNMMLSAEMLKREYQKLGGQQESAKWSVERNIPVTEDTICSRDRKNSGPLPTSMPSSGKDTAPGVISGEVEGWGSRSRCVSTDGGRQPSASRLKTKQTGSLSGAAGAGQNVTTGGFYNSYRRNFRPGISTNMQQSSQNSTHSREPKEKPPTKGSGAPRLKLWK